MYGNLPTDLTTFVGRRHELAELRKLLSRARLVTLTGPGGVGKTRLAQRLVGDLRSDVPDGVWFVDLASVVDPELVGATACDALQILDRAGIPIADRLVDYLSGKRALLLIDNCEQVNDAVADLVTTLLLKAPRVRLVVTSRTSLRVTGENVFAVGALDTPNADQSVSPESALSFDALSLFVERAQMARPGFSIDLGNLPAVVRICRRVEGIPLAIELAAARLRVLSAGQIAAYLDERFDVLAASGSARDARQGSIKAVLDWSYNLCSPEEQLLWNRLGVFHSSFDLIAAAAVCQGHDLIVADILDLVHGLVDKSILNVHEVAGVVRYQMLASVRAYAVDRLESSGEDQQVRQRHAEHFLALALKAEASWFTPQEHETLTLLDAERENIAAAITTLLSNSDAEKALALATALGFYWISRGSLPEGEHFLDRTLTLATANSVGRAEGLLVAGWIALNQGELQIADEFLDSSAQAAAALGNSWGLAHAIELKGLGCMLGEMWDNAIGHYEEALTMHRRAGNTFSTARTLARLATVCTLSGDTDRASELSREAVALTDASGDTWCRALLLTAMTIMEWERGDLGEARKMATESLRLKLKFNDRLGIAESLEILAWIAAAEQKHQEAARLLGAAQPLWEAVGGASVQMPRAHDLCVRRVWDALGPSEYISCIRWGKGNGWSRVVGETVGRSSAEVDGAPASITDGLTHREDEVASLVAEGLTNKEIAARLGISTRTAEGHIQHILAKLGFTSRSRIASWVAGQSGRDFRGRVPAGRRV